MGFAVGVVPASVDDVAVARGLHARGAALVAVQVAQDRCGGVEWPAAFADQLPAEVDVLGALVAGAVFRVAQRAAAVVDLKARAPLRFRGDNPPPVGVVAVGDAVGVDEAPGVVEDVAVGAADEVFLEAVAEDRRGREAGVAGAVPGARGPFAAGVPGVAALQGAGRVPDLVQAEGAGVVVIAPVLARLRHSAGAVERVVGPGFHVAAG